MQFLHWQVDAVNGTVVRVELDAQANVMLMDSSNFSSYRSGGRFRYFLVRGTPADVTAAFQGDPARLGLTGRMAGEWWLLERPERPN